MSEDDTNSGLPVRGRQGVSPEGKTDQPEKGPAGRADEISADESSRRATPVMRSAAWMIAILGIVLLMGFALAYLLAYLLRVYG